MKFKNIYYGSTKSAVIKEGRDEIEQESQKYYDNSIKKPIKQGVDKSVNAYWLSPDKKIYQVDSTHIDTIMSNYDEFGVTPTDIANAVEKAGGDFSSLSSEGDARNELMTDLLKKGWVRVRRYTKPMERWHIQVYTGKGGKLPRTAKNTILHWAKELMDTNPYSKSDPVIVLNEQGDIIFGSAGMLFSNQKKIEDLYLDDTGVFESLVIK